jgi:hypothetical protein
MGLSTTGLFFDFNSLEAGSRYPSLAREILSQWGKHTKKCACAESDGTILTEGFCFPRSREISQVEDRSASKSEDLLKPQKTKTQLSR